MTKPLATPAFLKQVNLRYLRETIRDMGSATRAELAAATGISVTTVGLLLTEMLDRGEIVVLGEDKSSGGRKAKRHGFNLEKNFGLAFCIEPREIACAVVNVLGEIVKLFTLPRDGSLGRALAQATADQKAIYDIRAVGVGVPGIVTDRGYLLIGADGVPDKTPLDELFRQFAGPVVLENDLNALAIGFAHRRARENQDTLEDVNMAYLHFDAVCISAGLIAEGSVIRGQRHFAGELAYLPFEGALTVANSAVDADPERYAQTVARTIAAVNCVTNPGYVVLGGYGFRPECFDRIAEFCADYIPAGAMPEILASGSTRRDFLEGMAFLTVEKILGSTFADYCSFSNG